MSAFLAFLGTFLLSLFVALLAALQLADYFVTTEDFAIVLLALPLFVTISLVAFVIANAVARSPLGLNATAACLALLAFAPLSLPLLGRPVIEATGHPLSAALANSAVALEFVISALIAVLVQWGLVRRRWLLLRGEDDLSLWPWIATTIGGLVILNPYGLEVIGQTIGHRPAGWLRDIVAVVTLSGAAALMAMVLIETYIRGRMLRRRLAPPVA